MANAPIEGADSQIALVQCLHKFLLNVCAQILFSIFQFYFTDNNPAFQSWPCILPPFSHFGMRTADFKDNGTLGNTNL